MDVSMVRECCCGRAGEPAAVVAVRNGVIVQVRGYERLEQSLRSEDRGSVFIRLGDGGTRAFDNVGGRKRMV